MKCNHEFVWREYPSQPYGTCAVCGAFVLGNESNQEENNGRNS